MSSIKHFNISIASLFLVFCMFMVIPAHTQSTSLAEALSNMDTVKAAALIAAGESPDQPDNNRGSLLGTYCRYSVADPMALFLLRHGAKPDTLRSPAGRTALHIAAAYYACEELCQALLDAGADVNARTNDGTTPLMLAAHSMKINLVKFLIAHGADATLKDKAGKNAYDYALTADAMNDMPDVKAKLSESCLLDKEATIAYLKDKVNK